MTESPQLTQHNEPGGKPGGKPGYEYFDRVLNRGLGPVSIVFMVVAAAAPMGVVAGSMPVLLSVSGSTGMPVFYIASMTLLILFSVGYVRISRFVRNAGAFYSYIQAGLGRKLGVGAAFLAVVSYFVLNIAVYTLFGIASANVVSSLSSGGLDLPWWLYSLLCVLLVGFLGYRDVSLSSKVLGILLLGETLTIVILDVAVVMAGGGDQGFDVASLNPSHLGDSGAAVGMMLAVLGFIGFEATAVFRHEARNPQKTIPRATYAAAVLIGLFYAFSAWAIISAVGGDQIIALATQDPENLVPNIGSQFIGSWFAIAIQVFLVGSNLACALALHNVLTRYGFSLARNGILPSRLAKVHEQHKSPARASFIVTTSYVVIVALLAVSQFDPMLSIYTPTAGLATFGYIILMCLTSASIAVFFIKRGDIRKQFGMLSTITIPLLVTVLFAALTILVIVNMDLLVGTFEVGIIVIVVAAVIFLVGVLTAATMKRRRPQAYEDLLSI